MRYVIDASVAVRWFIEEAAHPHADEILEHIVDQPGLFAVPELFLFEVYSVLQRHHPDAVRIFSRFVEPIVCSDVLRYPMTEHIYTKADRFIKLGLTGYDAIYAALACELEGKWITFDKKAHDLISTEHVSINLFDVSLQLNTL